MSLNTKDFYTADEVADLKGVHRKTVYRWVRDERLTPVMLGRMYWFEKTAVEAFTPPETGRPKKKDNQHGGTS